MQTIQVNGVSRKVTNRLSSGPGNPVHTYELTRGCYVYEVAGKWFLQEPGNFAIPCTVVA